MRFLILLLPLLTFAQSKIEINGKTNVSKFTCVNTSPIISQYFTETTANTIPATIQLYVKDFECNNRRMTEDFREMMDIGNHPIVSIRNGSYNYIKPNIYQSSSIVEMNGVKKEYSITLKNVAGGWNLRKMISLKDFNLKPPTILGGLVYVKEDVMINIYIED